MIGWLDFLGGVALVVGIVLWVLMVHSGLSNLREESRAPSTSSLDKPQE